MNMKPGDRIRELRRALGLSAEALAEKSGVGVATIRRIELGDADPKFSTLERIAQALGVPVAELLTRPRTVEAPEPAEVFAWAGVEEVAGRRFISIWEPGQRYGRVYAASPEAEVEAAVLDAVGCDLEELEAEMVEPTPFRRIWGAGPFGTNRPPERLFVVEVEGAELKLEHAPESAWEEAEAPRRR